jgi:RND superfamily putative drug exporter
VEQLCTLAKTVVAVEGVKAVQGAYAPTAQMNDCAVLARALAYSSGQTMLAQKAASSFVSGTYAKVQIITDYDENDHRNRDLMTRLTNAQYAEDVTVSLTGAAAQSLDTLDVYMKWLPYVIGVIAVAMILVLSILLGSVILPIQAVVINSVALFISLGVLIMIFQFGWGVSLLGAAASGGFELSIPILIFTMAFGLSMDYAVFLYSRMHEVYDLTNDPKEAIVGGVVKTGPIITAAALLMVTVVGAFASSHISLIQQIGIGLVVAVLVDAFFVRIIFVPAIMKLFGHASWWGPKWLKKMTIKHD